VRAGKDLELHPRETPAASSTPTTAVLRLEQEEQVGWRAHSRQPPSICRSNLIE
jgi:hypothetical protein